MGIKSNNSAASFFDFFSRSGIDAVLPEPLPAGPLYAEDLFSTYLYEGSNSAQTITNEIDLSGEGGLVWLKDRTGGWAHQHQLFDTERGATKVIYSDSTVNEATDTNGVTALNSNGFSIGTTGSINNSGNIYCSWTFRKCPGFFDVVTYTGTPSSPLTINHNLGSVPGCIMIKNRDSGNGWAVYHRGADSGSNPQNKKLVLNTDAAEADDNWWNYAVPTDTSFQLSGDPSVNAGGNNYVAYLFAHDEQSFGKNGDEAIIKCGTITTDGSGYVEEDLGFEPQWLMVKQTSGGGGDWLMFDVMRGFSARSGTTRNLSANTTNAEGDYPYFFVTSSGFEIDESSIGSHTFVYIAIRRPHKPPETATDVFAVNTESNDNDYTTTGFPVDAAISINRDGSSHTSLIGAKLIGENVLKTGLTDAESASLTYSTAYAFMDKFRYAFWGSDTNGFVNYAFKRAPGFFDVVAYTGSGSAVNRSHNLAAVPKLMIIKCRDSSQEWTVYAEPLGNQKSLVLNSNGTGYSGVNTWNSTTPTDTTFPVNGFGVNSSGSKYVAYLFGNLDGVSKVGSYTGTGNAINVDCGFTAGARFVLIKRTDSTGNWFVLDTARGIVSGNDPFMRLNLINSENSSTDMLDPYSAGFSVASGSTDVNATGGNYIFLAIA